MPLKLSQKVPFVSNSRCILGLFETLLGLNETLLGLEETLWGKNGTKCYTLGTPLGHTLVSREAKHSGEPRSETLWGFVEMVSRLKTKYMK